MKVISRRSLLTMLTASAVVLGTRMSLASAAEEKAPPATSGSRIRAVTRDARGVTIEMELSHAPFPAPGAAYKDATVIAFVPNHFRASGDGRVSVLVHFHGHNSNAPAAMAAHQLREQLHESKQNAILLVPQGPVQSADSSCGKLESDMGLARLLDDALRTLASEQARMALGTSAIRAGSQPGTVCLSAHSGGYHAAAQCVQRGGVPVTEVYLFDALYAEEAVFRDWVLAGRGQSARSRHKLVLYTTGGTTEVESQRLLTELGRAGVRTAVEEHEGTLSRAELTLAEVVLIRTQLSHGAVTHELNGLRDCLYASAMPRRLRTSWFDSKNNARPLERRR
jgi:hypothetical protein